MKYLVMLCDGMADEPVEKLNIFINGVQSVKYDGNTEANLNFGDDFINENNNIKLTWGNGTT